MRIHIYIKARAWDDGGIGEEGDADGPSGLNTFLSRVLRLFFFYVFYFYFKDSPSNNDVVAQHSRRQSFALQMLQMWVSER